MQGREQWEAYSLKGMSDYVRQFSGSRQITRVLETKGGSLGMECKVTLSSSIPGQLRLHVRVELYPHIVRFHYRAVAT